MADRVRPYLFYDVAVSICSACFRRIEGKILFEDGKVYMTKLCPVHGREKVLMADDIDYYKRCREVFIKPPEQPNHYQTPIRYGCPYDCGLCPDHEQHSCLSLVEVTDQCNLACPICYAASGPHRPGFRSLEQIEQMLDAIVHSEREPDVVQISGGEPTIHPDFFAILDAAKARPIRHLMVNTNGLRVAQDREFVRRLADYMPGFELYLQFDSFERDALMELRGADLRRVREQALAHLNEFGISTTLVVTLKKGLNDHEVGRIIDYAVQQPCVRGVTLQPIQAAGRLEQYDPATDRLTLTEVRRRILEQTSLFRPEDVIPVPCHPDSLAMAYALKLNGQILPLTGMIDPQILIEGGRNTIVFEEDTEVRERIFKLFATNHSPESQACSLSDLLCCLPKVAAPEGLTYQNVFRVLIMQFIDAHSFDLRSVKKSCVHIVHPDGRLIPFDTYNLFYRDGLEAERLAPIRRSLEAAGMAIGPKGGCGCE
ncbi:MAG: molybdenum cofactor biosynthesis protein [Symbiobacteriaceae bacterium]|nr:molybdenum cofactor biosynthesis protein [Symbiobacteriaceae bacterium]